ncbi:pyridoxamine 5'-phosphate oxidase family protein [Agromyces humatus]|uniref:Pyridoxamine 5'-phosphate oxidase family protein n=1 Tax=Agromyces humatus TaxID=279573 RepID=A0ABP4WS85_9MICO|nr:pyridoxamine 5'-phosphate oxidase family protein [Agromyces humatus]
MSRQYGCIAFTDDVRGLQAEYGSAAFYDRMSRRADGSEQSDALGPREAAFLTERDGFYLATVSETGWPYVQFRGGPQGFLTVRDDHTIAWADFRGNLQHVSTGNLVGDRRVAIIAVDYPRRQRLKLFGMARVIRIQDDPALVASVAVPGYNAVVEAAIVVTVTAFDWNCPQHIPQRFTLAHVEQRLAPLRERIRELEEQIAAGNQVGGTTGTTS